MELPFVTLDVFTNTRLEGNPLAVVTIPASLKDKLSQEKRQSIAKEFNLSETVFFYEPEEEKPSKLDIHIHTIDKELPFAGHPTIGTAVLAKYHRYPSVETLVTKAGPIHLSSSNASSSAFIRAKIPHDVHLHANTLGDVIPGEKQPNYPGLSDHPEIRDAELKAPIFSIVKGMTFALVQLPSLELLGQVQIKTLRIDQLPQPLLDPEWSPSFASRYYYVDQGTGADEKGAPVRNIRARMLELGMEDPATGSAASALTAYLTRVEKSTEASYVVVQGVEMGRRSVIHIQTTADAENAGEVKLQELWLGGEATVVQKGVLTVD